MASNNDYTSWTTAALIKRVTTLEAQLRLQNDKHSNTPTTPIQKKPKKPSKPFDPTKYHTRLIALKFAYLGGNYNGFEHHNNNTTRLPTIEEELWRALKKTKLIFPQYKEGQSEEDISWEGVEYSKCGRTDRGVSAFGQVVGVRVRSARPKAKRRDESDEEMEEGTEKEFDEVRDELPYIQLINRVLPSDIRVLAWCPSPPADFSARFNCKERRYRYFFTNPAFMPLPGSREVDGRPGEGWLDVKPMDEAAKKYEGLHDFRNFCKVDPSKQISNFERRIFHAGIHKVDPTSQSCSACQLLPSPQLYYFEVRGSAFLWHQVRHLVAILFLVGQGYEKPSVVDDLLDIHKTPARPFYEMASDVPLVLWDCIFPDPAKLEDGDSANSDARSQVGYEDGLNWAYVGDPVGGREQSKRQTTGVEDGKHGRNGVMDELWALWRKRKMDEVLSWNLMELVSLQGQQPASSLSTLPHDEERSARLFDGSETPRSVGPYTPLMQRERMETPDVVNARYAVRKGLHLNGEDKHVVDTNTDE